ncbi:MAG: aminotransferase class I/II-fold pyridoxal phosphate-dependent enzyme [Planctomycetes bacterium]|nr:aminotransferase class I/II-fold pyridoxal phosphate-dependent enzyme [Planctomycetota bacterium]
MSRNGNAYLRGDTAAKIAASVENAVRSGTLAAGRQLPPVRSAARMLGVSPATVAAAYQALQARGVLVAQGRRGTRVSHLPLHRSRPALVVPTNVRNLFDGNPDPALLPPLAPVLRDIDPAPCLYGEPREDEDLVRLMRRDFQDDGVDPGPIGVVNGALDGIERVLAEHLRPGDRVAVEDPGFGNIFDLVMSRGLSPAPLALDAAGVVPDDLERACRAGIKAFILTPRAQNPTGATLTETRARELRRVLRRFPDLIVIEDDHMNLISGAPLYCVHDPRRHRWAYVRSFSKALNPDFRLAVMTGDDTTLSRVQDRIIISRRWVSHLLQRIVYTMVSDPGVRRHLEGVAETYRRRRQAVLAALAAADLPTEAQAGFNVWLEVPEETSTVQALLAAGWAVSAGERFRLRTPPAIRLTVATLKPEEAPALAETLARVLRGAVAPATV